MPESPAPAAAGLRAPAPPWLLWGVAAAVLVVDFFTKRWVLESLAPIGTMQVLGDFVRFSYVRNSGVAFGLFADRGVPFGWVSVVALVLVLWLATRPSARSWPRPIALGLILGGAIGNMIDRVRWGSVVDFIDIGFGSLRWWVFNVADSAISVGVVLWAAHTLLARPTPKAPSAPSPEAEANSEGPPSAIAFPKAHARDDARGA
jgi:signal peptidase II